MTVIPIVFGPPGTVNNGHENMQGEVDIKKTNRDSPYYITVKIGKDT